MLLRYFLLLLCCVAVVLSDRVVVNRRARQRLPTREPTSSYGELEILPVDLRLRALLSCRCGHHSQPVQPQPQQDGGRPHQSQSASEADPVSAERRSDAAASGD